MSGGSAVEFARASMGKLAVLVPYTIRSFYSAMQYGGNLTCAGLQRRDQASCFVDTQMRGSFLETHVLLWRGVKAQTVPSDCRHSQGCCGRQQPERRAGPLQSPLLWPRQCMFTSFCNTKRPQSASNTSSAVHCSWLSCVIAPGVTVSSPNTMKRPCTGDEVLYQLIFACHCFAVQMLSMQMQLAGVPWT